VNYALMIGSVWLVLAFKSSSNLAGAYGVSVSLTMVITTFLAFYVARRHWDWSRAFALFVCGFFLIIDLGFLSANAMKISHGGWLPLALGAGMALLMATWREGRKILVQRIKASTPPFREFLPRVLKDQSIRRVKGTSVFMVGDVEMTPPAMVHNVKHNKVLHEQVLILTVLTLEVPYMEPGERLKIDQVADGAFKVEAYYGFMETPDVMALMAKIKKEGVDLVIPEVTFFVGRETLIASDRPGMAIWREHIFAFMARNAHRATQFFNIPADQVIEVGMQVEL
ncbi:MAG: KUP/HAK/KT family potassium transporter, partial [Bdellovibrionales bacterium]|jgi:KUP system potassium uptake protein|nr:KUP/HAK/KT family potassium transporter [Bdellovibrionales bacterium]